jgi:transformation/transcription domain-associated protein
MDLMQPKAWAELGKYYDKLYDDIPTDISHAVNAVNCYLHAAGLFKNGQCRPLLARILWLLSVDSDAKMISQTFHAYTGDRALWYWIPLIPHLCTSLSNREAEDAQYILAFIAKFYPQVHLFC